jgi:tripartite-type tricarboxylate transporter receptor subunit TctC
MYSVLNRAVIISAIILATAAGCSGDSEGTYPNRDIEIIIPYNAGGGFDTYVRALAPHMEKYLPNKVNILPINTPGAGGRRGASDVYRSKPDGYTLGIFNLPGVLIPQLQEENISYNLSEITWLATLSIDAYAVIVKPDSPLNNLNDVKNFGRPIVYGATGPSSTSYIATTIVNTALEIPYEIVTGYKGSSEYIVGVIRGDVDAAFANLSTVRPYHESGDVTMLALIGTESDDPAVSDAGDLGKPELGNISVIRMMGAPPGLPTDIRDTLEQAVLSALADPEFKKWLETTGNDVYPANARETTRSLADMTQFYQNFRQYFE